MSRLHADALATLESWQAGDDDQERLRTAYVDFLRAHPDGVRRSCLPSHLTASALVLDSTAGRVLLTNHRKGGFWAQLGGHCEPADTSLAEAALREAREESGIGDLRLVSSEPVDLDRHSLAEAFAPCGEHLDVRFSVVAVAGSEPVVSQESTDVRWWPADALPAGALDISDLVARARAAALNGAAPRE